jgi:NTP pyrophosphatase (non-canonical NTP hydrolase)
MELREIQNNVHALAREKGWWDAPRRPPEVLMLIVTELAEAMEEYRNGYGVAIRYNEDGKPEGMPIELADAVIRILDFCAYVDVDLEKYILLKHEYNKTRPYRHGGKAA